MALRGTQRHTAALNGTQWHSVALSGTQRPSEAIRGASALTCDEGGHQHAMREAIRGNQRGKRTHLARERYDRLERLG